MIQTVLFAVPGGIELVIIFLILVMLFGASRLPKLARSMGQSMGEFEKGREKVEQELDEMKESDEKEDKDT